MPALLLLPGFPNTNGPGTEGLGVGVDTVTGLTVRPDGVLGTPAQVRTAVEAALTAGESSIALAMLWRQPNAF
jgi:hypothetical protein